jgi:hypothetical protein
MIICFHKEKPPKGFLKKAGMMRIYEIDPNPRITNVLILDLDIC